MVYWVLFLLISSICTVGLTVKYRYLSLFTCLVFFPIAFLYMLRGDVGTDYSTYVDVWNGIYNGYKYDYLEKGFLSLINISIWMNTSAEFFLALFGFLVLVISFSGAKLLKLNISVFFLFYFLLVYLTYLFNGMRQALSMGMLVFSLYYMFQGRTFKVILISTISLLFHSTGLFIIISYFWARLNLVFIMKIVWFSLVLGFFGVFSDIALSILALYSPAKSQVYGELFIDKTSSFQILYRIINVLFFYWLYTKNRNDNLFLMIFKIYLLGVVFYFAFMDLNMLATRMNMFFNILIPVLIARYTRVSNVRERFIAFLLGIIVCFPSFYVQVNNPDNQYLFISER